MGVGGGGGERTYIIELGLVRGLGVAPANHGCSGGGRQGSVGEMDGKSEAHSDLWRGCGGRERSRLVLASQVRVT